MSQFIEGPRKTFTAGEALAAHRRVKISAVTGDYGPTVVLAGATDPCIGVTEDYVASGAAVTIYLANAQGTRKMMATAAAITGGNPVYAAASGYVASTGTVVEGKALETTAGSAGDLLEVLPVNNSDISTAISGTTNATFTVDSDSSAGKLKLDTAGCTGNFTMSFSLPASIGQNTVVTFPDPGGATASVVYTVMAQTIAGIKTFTSGITMSGAAPLTFTGTTGEPTIVLTANLADALSIVNGAVNDIMVFTTTTSLVALSIAKTVQIRLGRKAAAGAGGSAFLFAAAQDVDADGQIDCFSVFGESTSDLTSAYSAKAGRFRHIVTGSTITVNHETYGLIGQLGGKGATFAHMHAGLMGTFEGTGAAVVVNSAYTYGTAAVIGRIGGGANITATKALCGFSAVFNGAALASGNAFAYGATGTSTGTWLAMLALDLCDNLFYAATGTAYESGIKIGSISGLGSGASGLARVKVGSTLYYIPLYAAGDVTGE